MLSSIVRLNSQSARRLTCVAIRQHTIPAVYRSVLTPSRRWNSSASNAEAEKKKAIKDALKARDELQRDWDAPEILYEELKTKTISPSENGYLVDVRELDEVMQGMIPSAVHLSLPELAGALRMGPDEFKAKFGFTQPGQDQELTFYCRSGKRASSAADIAKRAGYTKLLVYKGSWLDWVEREGRKLEKEE